MILLDSIHPRPPAPTTTFLPAPARCSPVARGFDANALQRPKRFFGAARNVEEGGSPHHHRHGAGRHRQPHGRVIFEDSRAPATREIHLDRACTKSACPAINSTARHAP